MENIQKIQRADLVLDNKLHQISKAIFEFYGGCETCEHELCCAQSPSIRRYEIEKMARYVGLGKKKFKKRFLKKINIPHNIYKMRQPCPFRKNNECAIYPVRPSVCKNYPFDIGYGIVKLEGVNLCPTATLIASDIDIFIRKKNPDVDGLSEGEKILESVQQEAQDILKEAYDDAGLLPLENEYMMFSGNDLMDFYMEMME